MKMPRWLTVDYHAERPPRSAYATGMLVLRVLAVLVVLVIAAWLVVDQRYWRNVQEARREFVERFGAVDRRDFMPPRPAPENDAGRIYQYAAMIVARAENAHGDWNLFDAMVTGPDAFKEAGLTALPAQAEVDAAIAERMAALEPLWPVLRHASEKSEGALLHHGKLGETPLELKELRTLCRHMAARALNDARAGDLDGASEWLEAAMHLADLMREEPTIVAQMVRFACLSTNAEALAAVLSTANAPLDLESAYHEAWDRAVEKQWFIRGLASNSVFNWITELPFDSRIARARFVLATNDYFYQFVDALETPDGPNSARWRMSPATATNQGQPLGFRSGPGGNPVNVNTSRSAPLAALGQLETEITAQFPNAPRPQSGEPPEPRPEMLVLGWIRAADAIFRARAAREQVQIMQALHRYQIEQGNFPETLEALVPDYLVAEPMDPVSGQTFTYNRTEQGVELLSGPISPGRPFRLELKGQNHE